MRFHTFKLVRKKAMANKAVFCCSSCGKVIALYTLMTGKEVSKYWKEQHNEECSRWI